jgi:predicted regulator of Ras-like GTPase activity (Roadblock/LC7/MglB family)
VSRAEPGDLDPGERLFWTLMRTFETLAVERYAAHAPALLGAAKRRFVDGLDAVGVEPALLAASPLAAPVDALLASAQSPDELSTLLVQGLVLEFLAQAIYRLVQGSSRPVSATSRRLAAEGLTASAAVTAAAAERIPERIGRGDVLYAAFAGTSHDVLSMLDTLADPVDRVFGERFGLGFAEVMGEFTADLIGACTDLGMQRRKVVAHLAGAAMGIS